MTAWIVVIAAGLGSYLFRVSMLVVASRGRVPPMLERAARFAVPTAFTALAATALAHTVTTGTGSSAIAPLGAAGAAAVAVRITRKSQAALVVGLPVLWLLSAVH